jgi:hypothetical protein
VLLQVRDFTDTALKLLLPTQASGSRPNTFLVLFLLFCKKVLKSKKKVVGQVADELFMKDPNRK